MASADNGALLTERHLLIVALYLLGADETVARVMFAAVIDECYCDMCSVAGTTRAVLYCAPPPHKHRQPVAFIFHELDVKGLC